MSTRYEGRILGVAVFFGLLFFILWVGEHEENKRLRERLEYEESNIEQAQSELEVRFLSAQLQLGTLQSAVENLRANVDDFESENWKTVVPEVESSTSTVESELDSLESQMQAVEGSLLDR